ncbi:MAG: hypothetical protein IPK97_08440 [Ahniella sp.]|nr:hypothetical protein [Ahniella sp.]
MGSQHLDFHEKTCVLLIILALLGACSRRDCDFCGRWRSHADRTLQEMEKSPSLSPEQQAFFRNNFFGRLTVEIRESDSRTYFDDENPEHVAWEPFEIMSRSGNTYVVRYMVDDKSLIRTVVRDGSCYRVEQTELGFGEWFCKIQ